MNTSGWKLILIVTIMCLNDEFSWLFTYRFRTFFLIFRKKPNPSQNFSYSHSLNFHLSGKQPTQIIVQLNSSLRHIIVTILFYIMNRFWIWWLVLFSLTKSWNWCTFNIQCPSSNVFFKLLVLVRILWWKNMSRSRKIVLFYGGLF